MDQWVAATIGLGGCGFGPGQCVIVTQPENPSLDHHTPYSETVVANRSIVISPPPGQNLPRMTPLVGKI